MTKGIKIIMFRVIIKGVFTNNFHVLPWRLLGAALALAAVIGCNTGGQGNSAIEICNLFRDVGKTDKTSVSDYESLIFKSGNAEIYGQILKPDRMYGKNRPCVLLFHGFAGFARFDDLAQALCRAGCVVVIPHHRGAWGSRGRYLISNCVEDAMNLVNYVRSPQFVRRCGIDGNAIFLVGHSMGGNTVLNAAGFVDGVCGVVLLDPCDIGSMVKHGTPVAIKQFLVENGLDVLNTDGVDALYSDLIVHAQDYSFPIAVARLRGTSLFLANAEWGIDEKGKFLSSFCSALKQNANIKFGVCKTYKGCHGLMGERIAITHDIAEFISQCLK